MRLEKIQSPQNQDEREEDEKGQQQKTTGSTSALTLSHEPDSMISDHNRNYTHTIIPKPIGDNGNVRREGCEVGPTG